MEGTRAGASEKDVFVWEGPCRSRRWVDRGNNQLVHRVHGRFDASRDHPSRPCWTAQFMSHDDIYFVLYCIFGTWLHRFALFTIFATVSQTAPHHAEPHETSSLPRLQRHSFVPSQPAVIRHPLSYLCTISRLHTPTRILQLACGGESAASMASYYAGILRGWP
jgi:hypothetical protein